MALDLRVPLVRLVDGTGGGGSIRSIESMGHSHLPKMKIWASMARAYMASSGHRANILASKWNGVGVGYAKRGNYIYTVQFFIQTC